MNGDVGLSAKELQHAHQKPPPRNIYVQQGHWNDKVYCMSMSFWIENTVHLPSWAWSDCRWDGHVPCNNCTFVGQSSTESLHYLTCFTLSFWIEGRFEMASTLIVISGSAATIIAPIAAKKAATFGSSLIRKGASVPSRPRCALCLLANLKYDSPVRNSRASVIISALLFYRLWLWLCGVALSRSCAFRVLRFWGVALFRFCALGCSSFW